MPHATPEPEPSLPPATQSSPPVSTAGNSLDLTFPAPLVASGISSIVADALRPGASTEELINALKTHPRLLALFEMPPPLEYQYRLDDHTHAVLRQYEKYFADSPLPGTVRPEVMRLALALHDIGKYIPPSTEEQHAATVSVLYGVREHLPVSDSEFALMLALIDGDPIGQASARLGGRDYTAPCVLPVTGADLDRHSNTAVQLTDDPATIQTAAERAAPEIVLMAQKAGIPALDFLTVLTRYYQCDSSSYSVDGELLNGRRAHISLEFIYRYGDCLPRSPGERLFIVDSSSGHLAFAAPFNALYEAIFDEVNSLALMFDARGPTPVAGARGTSGLTEDETGKRL